MEQKLILWGWEYSGGSWYTSTCAVSSSLGGWPPFWKSALQGSQRTDWHLLHTPRLFSLDEVGRRVENIKYMPWTQTPQRLGSFYSALQRQRQSFLCDALDMLPTLGKEELSEEEDELQYSSNRHYMVPFNASSLTRKRKQHLAKCITLT